MLKYILLLLITFSCSLNNNINYKKESLPQWYINPTPNNNLFLYGVGYGSSMEIATKSALNNIAEKISTNISSSMLSNNKESSINNNSIFEEDYNQNIIAITKNIELNNYIVQKSEMIADKIYLLIQIKKEEIINNYKSKIKELDDNISSSIINLDKLSNLRQFIILSKLDEKISKNKDNIKILNLIDKNNKFSQIYFNKYQKLLKLKNQLNSKITLNIIEIDNAKISNIIANNLNKINIKTIINNKDISQNPLIKINYKINKEKIYNVYLTKMKLYIDLIDNYENIASAIIDLKSSSIIDYDQSFNNILNNLQKKLNKENIFKLLLQ